jgi:hypothetical protein
MPAFAPLLIPAGGGGGGFPVTVGDAGEVFDGKELEGEEVALEEEDEEEGEEDEELVDTELVLAGVLSEKVSASTAVIETKVTPTGSFRPAPFLAVASCA